MEVLQLVNTRRPFFDQQVEALEARGVDCTTLTVPGEHTTDAGHGVADYARFQAALLRHAGDYDLVHANYGLLGPLALAQPTRPVVLTLWGSEIMGHAWWLDRVSSLAARGSDAVVVPTQEMSPHVPCEHEVVPFGVDTQQFAPVPQSQARERLGWPQDQDIVLFPYPPARPVKNFPLAESVVDGVDADAELRTMSEVPHERVPLYMNASDAVLVTSRRESGPMVVKEAAACNVPVVATDVGFVDRVLEDVSHSYCCASEAELRARLESVLDCGARSDGRAVLTDLSLDRMGDQLTDVYRSVLGAG